MKLRAIITVIGTAAAFGATGAFLLPASASPRAATHTLTFTAVQQASVNFSKTTTGTSDKDISHHKVIGFDMLHFTFNPKTDKASGVATVDLLGGFLYGSLTVSNSPDLHGRVTGGTGAYRGATGTITAKPLNKAGSRTAVTIKYRT